MSSGDTHLAARRSDQQQGSSSSATGALSTLGRYVRTGVRSGLFAAVLGLVSIRRARRALDEGSSLRATRHATMAVFWIGVAMTQWGLDRSSSEAFLPGELEPSDVVDTAPHIEDVSSGSDDGSGESTSIDVTERRAAPDVEGEEPESDVEESDVVDTGTDASSIADEEGDETGDDETDDAQ